MDLEEDSLNKKRPLKPVYVFLANAERENRIVRSTVLRPSGNHIIIVADADLTLSPNFVELRDAYEERVLLKYELNVSKEEKAKEEKPSKTKKRSAPDSSPTVGNNSMVELSMKENSDAFDLESIVRASSKRAKVNPIRPVLVPFPISNCVNEIFNHVMTRRGTSSILRVLLMLEPGGICFAARCIHACIVDRLSESSFSVMDILEHVTIPIVISCFQLPGMLLRHLAVQLYGID